MTRNFTTTQKCFALAVAFAALWILAMLIVPVTGDGPQDDCGRLWTAMRGGGYTYRYSASSVLGCKSAGESRLMSMAMVALLLGGTGITGIFLFRPKETA